MAVGAGLFAALCLLVAAAAVAAYLRPLPAAPADPDPAPAPPDPGPDPDADAGAEQRLAADFNRLVPDWQQDTDPLFTGRNRPELGFSMGGVAITAVAGEIADQAVQLAIRGPGKPAYTLLSGKFLKRVGTLGAVGRLGAAFLRSLFSPVNLALLILDLAVVLVLDLVDPAQEKLRRSWAEVGDGAGLREAAQAAYAALFGQPWPPVMPVARLLPDETRAAMGRAQGFYTAAAAAEIVRDPRQPELAAYIHEAVARAGGGPGDPAAFAARLAALGSARSFAELELEFRGRAEDRMHADPGARDALLLMELRAELDARNAEARPAAEAAPFWHFALCVPAAHAGAPAAALAVAPCVPGVAYAAAGPDDIKVGPLTARGAEEYVDIVRAKLPGGEERVRAFRLDPGWLDPAEAAAAPELPDPAAVRARSAEYTRVGTVEPQLRRFGWRDSHRAAGPGNTDVPGRAHSAWLAGAVMQRFLLRLAAHPGVALLPGGAPDAVREAAAERDGGAGRLRGVFRLRGQLFVAPCPRPWHEQRFVAAGGPGAGGGPLLQLTPAAVCRWNEAHAAVWLGGPVLADLAGDPHAQPPPVAVWSAEYPELLPGDPPFAPANRLLPSADKLLGPIEARGDGRLHLRVATTRRVVHAVPLLEAERMDAARRRAVFGAAVDAAPALGAAGAGGRLPEGPAGRLVLLRAGGAVYAACNLNARSLNPWLRADERVLPAGAALAAVAELAGGRAAFSRGSVQLEVTLADPVEERRFAQAWPATPGRPVEEEADQVVGLLPAAAPAPELLPGRTAVQLPAGAPGGGGWRVFVNHDGTFAPAWRAGTTARRMARPCAMLIDCVEAWAMCNGGLVGDESPFHVGATDAEMARGEGYHIHYASGALPVVERSAAPGRPYLHFRDAALHPGTGGFLRWDPDRRRCAVTDPERAWAFCKDYKGMSFDAGQGDCELSAGQKLVEGMIGYTLTRLVSRRV